MRTPAAALVWETWRLTRGRFIVAGALATIGGAALLAAAGDQAGTAAVAVLFLVATIAIVTALDLPLTKLGFPFTASFARPVSTGALVLTPMLCLAALGAALYFVPLVLLRVFFGVPFPLVTASAWIAAGVLGQIGSSWGTKGSTPRLIARIVVLSAVLDLAFRLNPSSTFPPDLSVASSFDPMPFSAAEAAALVLIGAAAIGWALRSVARQRHGPHDRTAADVPGSAGRRRLPIGDVRMRLRAALGALPCPTASGILAELWLEMRRFGLTVLGTSLLVAAAIPPLLAVGNAQGWRAPIFLAFGSLLTPVLAALGTASTEPRGRRRGLSVFEATRPISTARLAAVRTAVPAASILASWLAIGASLWLSLPLSDGVWDSAPLRDAVAESVSGIPAATFAAWSAVALVIYAAGVAALRALSAYFVLYGRRLAGAFLCSFGYAIALLGAAAVRLIGFEVIVWHLWAALAAVGVGTAFVLGRAIGKRVLRPAHVGVALLVWALFAAVWAALLADGHAPSNPLSAAAAAAGALLPLLSLAITPWSLYRLRHA